MADDDAAELSHTTAIDAGDARPDAVLKEPIP
jgi:hypothetical protein